MFKKQKWFNLTTPCVYEKHTVPIFRASAGCRKVPLVKTLMSSYCRNDCKFCALRCERRVSRNRWEPEELANITYKLWKMKKVEGIFLSSSVDGDPDFVVEKQIQTIEILRKKGFVDYVHLKMMPGTSRELIKKAVEISDRVGINIELPNKGHYEDMKLYLSFMQDIIRRLRWIAEEVEKSQKDGKCKAGLDSQMVVGASDETDREIIKISDWIYQKLNAQRVYYSRFDPIKNTPLQNKKSENPWREYRLYQSSFLLRDYDFRSKDFIFDDNDRLNLREDPKFSIAKENELIVDINNAKFKELTKVPGIGLKTAQKIIDLRPVKNFSTLKSIGVITKRAMPFIDVNNVHQTTISKWLN